MLPPSYIARACPASTCLRTRHAHGLRACLSDRRGNGCAVPTCPTDAAADHHASHPSEHALRAALLRVPSVPLRAPRRPRRLGSSPFASALHHGLRARGAARPAPPPGRLHETVGGGACIAKRWCLPHLSPRLSPRLWLLGAAPPTSRRMQGRGATRVGNGATGGCRPTARPARQAADVPHRSFYRQRPRLAVHRQRLLGRRADRLSHAGPFTRRAECPRPPSTRIPALAPPWPRAPPCPALGLVALLRQIRVCPTGPLPPRLSCHGPTPQTHSKVLSSERAEDACRRAAGQAGAADSMMHESHEEMDKVLELVQKFLTTCGRSEAPKLLGVEASASPEGGALDGAAPPRGGCWEGCVCSVHRDARRQEWQVRAGEGGGGEKREEKVDGVPPSCAGYWRPPRQRRTRTPLRLLGLFPRPLPQDAARLSHPRPAMLLPF